MIVLTMVVVLAMLAGALSVLVGIFMVSCRMAGLPRPRVMVAVGVVLATLVVWFVIEAAFFAALRKLYAMAGFPPWEVWLVGIFAGLPVSLAVGTGLHMLLMRVPTSKAVQVWFIERLIRFSIILIGVGLFVVAMLAAKK